MPTQCTRLWGALLALLVVGLASCSSGQSPAAKPTSTVVASVPTGVATQTPVPTVTPTPRPATPAPSPTLSLPSGFEVLDPTGRHPREVRLVRSLLPEMLEYLEDRTGEQLQPPVKVVVSTIRRGDRCAVRGLALPSAGQIYIYVGEGVSDAQIATALPHELAHVLHEQVAGGNVASVTLAEGFATYAQGRYWPLWDEATGFQGAVRRFREEGSYMPLTRSTLPCDTDTRDRIYTERAAFVEWLIKGYGRERFLRVNRLSASPEDSELQEDELPYIEPPVLEENPTYEHAHWKEVYGKDLGELEQEWLSSL
ncbi:MAG: hypothetical protein M3P51_05560 [Chloroflexota bacterium]|nr:hypothetical protein [Chloroflexota bacterium]